MKIFLSFLFLCFIGIACSSSLKLTSSWKSPELQPVKYKKLLVLGLIRDADRSLQENMERHVADDLIEKGYNVVTALNAYGPKAFENIDENTALDKLKNSGVDAVITIVLLDKQKERNYVPGSMNYSPYGMYYNRFWGYRTALYQRIYEPGYYVTNTKYFWESNLYNLATKQLLYSVQTQSFDLENSNKLGHEYGQMIVKDMINKQVIVQ
jgi:hypothetical protein